MSAKAGSIGGIVVGAVLIVVGAVLTAYGQLYGIGLITSGVGMVAGGAVGLAYQPKSSSAEGAKARQLEVATAAEGFPIPVIWGEQKVTGNFMEYRKEFFRSVKIYGQPVSGGGKGGGSDEPKGVVGFDYYLQFEYALCMGPIDSVMQVWSAPGEVAMREDNPVPELVYAPGQEFLEFTLGGKQEGGLLRLYRGAKNQTRVNPNGSDKYFQDYISFVEVTAGGAGYNGNSKAQVVGDGTGAEVSLVIEAGEVVSVRILKRGYGYTAATITTTGPGAGAVFEVQILGNTLHYQNICWALMGPGDGFKIGRFPQPKSYQFVLRRLPGDFDADGLGTKGMRRDDGTLIAGFKIRGSNDSTKPGYIGANPAAMAYEILTNRLWGRGYSSAMIHEASFVAASNYFAERHIGMNYMADSPEKLSEFLDLLRTHLRTIMVWDGELLKMRVLMNPAETKANIQTLTPSHISGFRTTRPDWSQTYSELRAEYISTLRNYRPDLVHVMDGANISINRGRINPLRINLPAFSDFNTVWKQLQRMLREYSYPLATAAWEMNMFRSQVEVGDTVRIQWPEYGAGIQTTYWIVLKKEEVESDSEMIKVEAIEDHDMTPLDGEEDESDIPSTQFWEELPDLNPADIGLFITPGTANNDVFPVAVYELSPIITQNKRFLIFLGQKGNEGVTGFAIYWKQGNAEFKFLENYDSFSITGNLATAIDDTFFTDRSAEGAFEFSLRDPENDEAPMLSACSRVILPSDSLEDLLDAESAIMFVEQEAIQIGYVEKIGVNQYRAYNVIRGALGTEIKVHPALAPFYFIDALPLKVNLAGTGIKNDTVTAFRVNPLGTLGATETGSPFYPIWTDTDLNEKILGVGMSPLPPIPIRKVVDHGQYWKFTLRPRFYHKGAGTKPFFQAILDLNEELDGMNFVIRQLDAAGNYLKDSRDISYAIPRSWRAGGDGDDKPNYFPETMNDETAGVVVLSNVYVEADCAELQIFSRVGSARSVEPCRFYFN
jgi:hypothetical protein